MNMQAEEVPWTERGTVDITHELYAALKLQIWPGCRHKMYSNDYRIIYIQIYIYGDVPIIIPVIRTFQTARSARRPRCLPGRVDSSALSSRLIFPSARSPNITPITAIVATKCWSTARGRVSRGAKFGNKRGGEFYLSAWAWIKLPFLLCACRSGEWCKLWGQLLAVIHWL